ncbi:MAG TPA: hypothetical protein VGS22_29135 [Thermoanaerobaculia bacterium]|jgi:hypothetical protein|nr:hypothetical protein [Thermoanaerobaculia bacterium]
MIKTTNEGQAIVESSYWTSDLARAGKVYASVNAGAVRVLLPPQLRELPEEVASAQYALLSRGPWPAQQLAEAVEILWEDGSQSPYALHLDVASFDLLPANPGLEEWLVATWDQDDAGRPRLRTQHTCFWRRVPTLPWLKPLKQ